MKNNQELNELGLFPGPNEAEESFLKRASSALSNGYQSDYPSIRAYYGFSPDWISIDYSNKKLLPWEGGCTWIFEEEGVLKTSLQLRNNFKTKGIYLKFYKKDEILTHELAHIGRIAFEEPKFEEFLAYRTSENRFRKTFSPLMENGYEPPLFLSLLVVINLIFPFYLNIAPLLLLLAAFLRLRKRHLTYQEAINSLKPLLEEKTESFLYRLGDEEIIFCANNPLNTIVEKFSKNTFRYQFLRECYFNTITP